MTASTGGFDEVTPFDDARTRLESLCSPHGRVETVALASARGRVAAASVTAPRPVPHYDRAAMDGFAVRAEDTFGASERSPTTLSVTREPVAAGETARVHTGSALPEGTDAVVMVEHTDCRAETVVVYDAVSVGENVAPAGEDVDAGAQLLAAGERLSPATIAVLRATGIETIDVSERPRVSVIPTGEELVESDPEPGEVIETNGRMVGALVDQWGGVPTVRETVTDDSSSLSAAIAADTDHDIVVTTGGSSVGERDLLPEILAELGTLHVHGVGIKPGHPVGFGTVEETLVVLLPGYPVSCYLNAVQFLRPALSTVAGTTPRAPPTVRATLAEKLPSSPGTRTFARVSLEREETADHQPPADDRSSPARAVPISVSGAGVLSGVAFADGWVEIPEPMEGFPAGECVDVQQWDWTWRA